VDPSGEDAGRNRDRSSPAAAGFTTLESLSPHARAQVNANGKLRILQIGVGGIGGLERSRLKDHPRVEFAGFCDVDRQALDKMAVEFLSAWRVADDREGFAPPKVS